MENNKKLRIIDLFAGIGGFHLAFHNVGAKCVFASEIDKYARKTYEHNFKKMSPDLFKDNMFKGDIQDIDLNEIPDFDILCAGFPCQPFSQIGYRRGFQEKQANRGNMFLEIVKILDAKRPKAFFLENVRHLLKHDGGRTFNIIKKTLEGLGYSFKYKIVKASDYGLPQHRPRLFMVGFKG
ncbi:MAG: DNA cytosine methyltransferase, partial [Candidatus Omnitrophica bacterium]|nr:DNA cytosine methyltransferase [Candidatus Omnitrophota bacterium]